MADFGRSKLIEHRGFTTATIAGSARQMAPELLQREEEEAEDNMAVAEDDQPTDSKVPELPKLSKEADVYALSMVALEVNHPCDSLQHQWLLSGVGAFFANLAQFLLDYFGKNPFFPPFPRYVCRLSCAVG